VNDAAFEVQMGNSWKLKSIGHTYRGIGDAYHFIRRSRTRTAGSWRLPALQDTGEWRQIVVGVGD